MAQLDPRALRTLLASIVDYAGLFPPATLELGEAVTRYVRYRRGESAWMLGRFVVPSSRLEELAEILGNLAAEEVPLALSVVLSTAAEEDGAALERASRSLAGRADIVSVEVPPLDAERIGRVAEAIPDGVELYFELRVPASEGTERTESSAGLERALLAVRKAGAGAKIRTGGTTAAAIPSVEQVSGFIEACRATGVPFKATAGLHHPLRGSQPLTYEPDSELAVMHGFLNVVVAAALGWTGAESGAVSAALRESSTESLSADHEAISWCGLRLARAEIGQARNSFFLSFGSCSFEEPVDELSELQLI